MEGLNGELADLLLKKEYFRLQQLISVQTAPLLLEQFKNASSPGVNMDDKEQELHTSIEYLTKETEAYEQVLANYMRIGGEIKELRDRAANVPLNKDDGESPPQVSTHDADCLLFVSLLAVLVGSGPCEYGNVLGPRLGPG
jgi:hypothetical protein